MRRTDMNEEKEIKAGKAIIISTLIILVLVIIDALRYYIFKMQEIPFPSSTIVIIGGGILVRSIYLSAKDLILSANTIIKPIAMGLFSVVAIIFFAMNYNSIIKEGFLSEISLSLVGVLLLIIGFFIESLGGYKAYNNMLKKKEHENATTN